MLAKHHRERVEKFKEINQRKMKNARREVNSLTYLYAKGVTETMIPYNWKVPLAKNTSLILVLRALKYKDIHCKLRKVKDHDGRPRLKITFTGLIK